MSPLTRLSLGQPYRSKKRMRSYYCPCTSPKILMGPCTLSTMGCFMRMFWVSRQSFLMSSEEKGKEVPEGFQSLGRRSSLMKESTTEFSKRSECLIYCMPCLFTFLLSSCKLFSCTSEFLPVSNTDTVALRFHLI